MIKLMHYVEIKGNISFNDEKYYEGKDEQLFSLKMNSSLRHERKSNNTLWEHNIMVRKGAK